MTTIKGKKRIDIFPYAIVAPAMIILIVGMVFPIAWTVYNSFTDKKIGAEANFTGISNYAYLLDDDAFRQSAANTAVYSIGAVAGKLVLGLVIALLLHGNLFRRGFIFNKRILRPAFLLPWTIPGVVAIYIWSSLYTGNGGIFNYAFLNLGLISKPIGWLSTPVMAMFSMILVNIWRGTPFFTINILAGLQTVPDELYEAARIDGANKWHEFFYITLPSVKGIVMVTALVSLIWTINDFETPWLLTGGGPGTSTSIISIVTWNYAFGLRGMGFLGRASASSLLTMPVMLLIMIPVIRNLIKGEHS
jgi:multiple sugar transport system permease protein